MQKINHKCKKKDHFFSGLGRFFLHFLHLFKEGLIVKIIISEKAKEKLNMMGKSTMTIYTEIVGSC
jgi:hypothetical protein